MCSRNFSWFKKYLVKISHRSLLANFVKSRLVLALSIALLVIVTAELVHSVATASAVDPSKRSSGDVDKYRSESPTETVDNQQQADQVPLYEVLVPIQGLETEEPVQHSESKTNATSKKRRKSKPGRGAGRQRRLHQRK
jgi:hypothetical protein